MIRGRRYSTSLLVSGPAANAAFAELIAGGRTLDIFEIALSGHLTADTSIGLARTATVGTSTSSNPAVSHSGVAGAASVATSWSAAPTLDSTPLYLRRFAGLAGDKIGVVWPFDENDLVVHGDASLALWNFGAGVASDLLVTISWDERY